MREDEADNFVQINSGKAQWQIIEYRCKSGVSSERDLDVKIKLVLRESKMITMRTIDNYQVLC